MRKQRNDIRDTQPERLEEMLQLRHEGYTLETIAEKFGVSRSRVFSILKRADAPAPPRGRPPVDWVLIHRAVSMYRGGNGTVDIAKALGVSRSTVYNYLRKGKGGI